MAIYGNLSDLPFTEMVTMLDRRIGRLELSHLPTPGHYELHLIGGRLRLMTFNGTHLDDVLAVREHLARLVGATSGKFEFVNTGAELFTGSLNISLQHALMSITVVIDETERYRSSFADPRTRFEALQMPDVIADPDLDEFWQRCYVALIGGVDAETLARDQKLKLERVQFYLYKLRVAGLIAPVRAATPRTAPQLGRAPGAQAAGHVGTVIRPPAPPAPQVSTVTPRPIGLIGRLLAALKGR